MKFLLSLSLAVPIVMANSIQSFTINYNFDTRVVNPLVATTEVREYDLLNFKNINYVNESLQVTGVAPHTSPNIVAFTLNTLLADLDGPDFRITTQYYESTIAAFDAISWYYGCAVASEESTLASPASCIITATGYDVFGKQRAVQNFTYVATSLKQNLTYAKFNPYFTTLQYIKLTVTNNATVTGLFDNLIATVYQAASAPFY